MEVPSLIRDEKIHSWALRTPRHQQRPPFRQNLHRGISPDGAPVGPIEETARDTGRKGFGSSKNAFTSFGCTSNSMTYRLIAICPYASGFGLWAWSGQGSAQWERRGPPRPLCSKMPTRTLAFLPWVCHNTSIGGTEAQVTRPIFCLDSSAAWLPHCQESAP